MPFTTSFAGGAQNRVHMATVADDGTLGQYVEIAVFRFGADESDEGHEVTSSVHRGLPAFVASILRCECQVSLHIRSEDAAGNAAYPSTIGIKAQKNVVFKLEFGNREEHIIPVYISRVGYMTDTAAGTDAQITCKLNNEITQFNSTLAYSYPAA